MRPGRDLAIFVILVVAFSAIIGAAVLYISDADALIAVAASSVMLSARGVAWPRKLAYAAIALVGTIAGERWHEILQAADLVGGSTDEVARIVAGMVRIVFLMAYPLAVLVVFVGRDPSVLWIPANRTSEKARQQARSFKSKAKPPRSR